MCMRIRSPAVKKLASPSFAIHLDFDSTQARRRGHSRQYANAGAALEERRSHCAPTQAQHPASAPKIPQLLHSIGSSDGAVDTGKTRGSDIGVDGFAREEGQSCAATVPVLLMVAKVCVASYSLLMQDKELECVHGTYSGREERFAVVRCGSGIDTFENV